MTARGTARVVWLDEAGAQDPAVAGAKASRLARARARGLPVPDGFVTPVEVSDPAIRAAEAVLGSQNSGAARSAVYNHPPPPLVLDLAESARRLGDTLVVRSSSRAEAAGVWAGAFSSYLGLKPEELAGGVMGCWASVFNPDTLKRGEVTGTPPHEVGMAVARPTRDPTELGRRSPPQERTEPSRWPPPGDTRPRWWPGGREERVAVVTARGEVQGDPPPPDARLLREIADLSRMTREKMAWDHIEWMVDRTGKLHLVQAQPTAGMGRGGARDRAPDPPRAGEPWMRSVVRMMIRYPGPVGERFVWPWAVGLDGLCPAPAEPITAPVASLVEEVRRGSARLMSRRWGETGAPAELGRAWAALLGGDTFPLPGLFSRFPSVDRRLAAEHLRNLRELGRTLAAAGAIPHPGWFWYLDPDRLDRPAPTREGPMRRVGTTFWDAWIHGVVASQGDAVSGNPAAGGWGVGRLRFIDNADDAARFCPREVIATSLPVGNLAPLLWNAAGLITSGGSPGAHLFEVADWLAVPAVCGVDLGRWTAVNRGRSRQATDLIAAVDGDRGRVIML